MDSRKAIMNATIDLIHEKGDALDEITVREICKRANVGLGLINYHFGSKDKLIEICVEDIVNKIVGMLGGMLEKTVGMTPFERLEYAGNMTLAFLFDHSAVSKISILTDMRAPKADDNTNRTYSAFLPLVADCRPDWDGETLKRRTFSLITVMQQTFLRQEEILRTQGLDLTDKPTREAFHRKILTDIMEVKE